MDIPLQAQSFTKAEIARWQQQAKQVTITRDTWGVPHIYGKTDADVVFGLLFTQCEDDFARVEENYITSTRATGRSRGRIGPVPRSAGPAVSGHDPGHCHLQKKPALDEEAARCLRRWHQLLPLHAPRRKAQAAEALSALDAAHVQRGQHWRQYQRGVDGAAESVLRAAKIDLLDRPHVDQYERESIGSNGFAIAPAKSATKNALLLINPHTSFYFRSEVQMVSQAGLNAYGAVTWGQFFIYQGFNENCGWMHTTSYADSMDEYLETIEKKGNALYYKHGKELKPVRTQKVRIPYKTASGMQYKEFTMYFTQHGPIAGEKDGKWIAIDMMNTPLNALSQSYLRTKATDYASFKEVMKLNGNASNNTIFADKNGTIAYWHGNFMPKRDPKFDWEATR